MVYTKAHARFYTESELVIEQFESGSNALSNTFKQVHKGGWHNFLLKCMLVTGTKPTTVATDLCTAQSATSEYLDNMQRGRFDSSVGCLWLRHNRLEFLTVPLVEISPILLIESSRFGFAYPLHNDCFDDPEMERH